MISVPEISVIIPCFNDGRFLEEALESVQAQTIHPAEILIINDGSTDPETLKYLENVRTRGIRVIDQENRGLSGARNTGIRCSQSSYMYFLDADDLMYPDCLAKLWDLMEKNPNAVAAASRISILGGPFHGTEWCEPCHPYLLLVNNQLCAGIMLRRDSVEKYNLWYDESMRYGYEDWEFNIRLLKTGKPILFWPEPLYQYRQRRKSLLATARQRHVEILTYIRNKHRDLYAPDKLLACKNLHAPALLVSCLPGEQTEVERLLTRQTFHDWVLNTRASKGGIEKVRYRFHYASIQGLSRLPAEALETAIIALETNPNARHCVLGVKETGVSWLANAGVFDPSRRPCHPVAVLVRDSQPQQGIPDVLSNCQLLIELADQNTEVNSGWDTNLLRFSEETVLSRNDLTAFRKRLSLLGKKLLGPKFQEKCVTLYDSMYGILVSDKSLEFRRWLRDHLGEDTERVLSNAFYGLFLMKAPTYEDNHHWNTARSSSRYTQPLFLNGFSPKRANVLIATGWLNEGGVEQEIFDLCRHLDSTRFRVIIATTRPSSQPWDGQARKIGVLLYHLADVLRPSAIPHGLLHLVLNHHVDCLHIIHSRAAYESLKLLRGTTPWLSITDRNVILDPGGGFVPMSAKLGKELLDFRTVGHVKLAEYMSGTYNLPPESLRVIYAGTDIRRIEELLSSRQKLLHEMCHVGSDTPMVIFTGRLVPQKRPEVFVRSVAKILEIQPECKAHFAMVGSGELKGSVEKLVAHYHLEGRVHLLGAHPNAIELIADATLLMMPSAYEGLALVSYEAMALGVPQIFANVNGQPELITPETGILVDNGRGEETRYARACLELLNDPDRRLRMGAAGKERIRSHFTAENAVKQYAEIFEELAELSRKRAAEIPHLRPPHINPMSELA